MSRSIILTAVVALFAGALGSLAMDSITSGAGTARSASELTSVDQVHPTGETEGQIQGDTDCDTDVDAIDALGVLVNVAALDALAQQEPCTDVADLIPAGEGIPGPQGPAGPQGEQGPPGISGLEQVHIAPESSAELLKKEFATCPDGKTLISGGFRVSGVSDGVRILESRPEVTGPQEWVVSAFDDDMSGDWRLEAYALCANVAE